MTLKKWRMNMIHIDDVKKGLLFILFLFVSWNWAAAEHEVRTLALVGSSLGDGWQTCMVEVAPRVDRLQELTNEIIGKAAEGDHSP